MTIYVFPPYKDTELVLKVRVQNPKEYDFIEIELDRKQLTYQDLLNVCCCELGINSEQVEKIRKLPNTLLRKVKHNNFLLNIYLVTLSVENGSLSKIVHKRHGTSSCYYCDVQFIFLIN